jgi:type II secretory pathway predicted ATPase ExeA
VALFDSAQHKELLARLTYTVHHRGFALVTGEIGSGKSTAVRALAAGLDPSRHQLLYVAQSGLTPRHLYRELCLRMSIQPAFHAAEARRQLIAALWDAAQKYERQPVVVIDEAHLLSPPLLEEIRFLTFCRGDDYAEQVGSGRAPSARGIQALGIITELQETRAAYREDDSGQVLC